MNKTIKLKLGLLSLVASALLVGCGSDSTSTDTTNLSTGYFIDAPVEGLMYETASGIQGVTDQYGKFQYQNGESVRFMVGKLDIGTAVPAADGLVTPETIAQNDEELKIYLLRVLQALDSDNDPANGITISQEVVDALNTITEEIAITSVTDDAQLLNIDDTLEAALDENGDGLIDVNDTAALAHFEQSVMMWQNGHKPDQNTTQPHGPGNGQGTGGHGTGGGNQFDLSLYPESELTQELKDALAFMGNEERLAYDIYTNLYNYHAENGNTIMQLINIATNSEIQHIGIAQDLVRRYNLTADDVTNVDNPLADNTIAIEDMPSGKYDVASIQALYDTLYSKGVQSVQDALEVGCMVEVTDVNDLDIRIAAAEEANATDIVAAFNVLRNGSYNHYWSFDKGLKNMGVEEGCAVLGAEYAKTPEEFPASNGH